MSSYCISNGSKLLVIEWTSITILNCNCIRFLQDNFFRAKLASMVIINADHLITDDDLEVG